MSRRHPLDRAVRRRGFTLVELLVTIVIISILASIVLGALQAARETARTAKTRATIAKLHQVIMGMYETYRTRRVPISTAGADPKAAAATRLGVLRDIMRMEMPDRWADIVDNPISGIPRPALSQAYKARYDTNAPKVSYGSAKCLYLVVTMGCRAKALFSESEIAIPDGDGYPVFVDGWGNPIRFLRWAPEFPDSELQANVMTLSGANYTRVAGLAAAAAQADHDPFDPRKVDTGWRLVPLIYSPGPDGIYDIEIDPSYHYAGNPYATSAGKPIDSVNTESITAPGPVNGRLDHYDNITNHRLQGNK